MEEPAVSGAPARTTFDSPPPMPSIYASALLETRRLVATTRRVLATMLSTRLG